MQVHHDEGVANRIDPESCAAAREGISEALTGERIGQPLSRESTLILGADVVPLTEGNTDGRDIASAQTARRGRRHWHVRKFLAREPGDPTSDHRHVADLVRIGKVQIKPKPMMHGLVRRLRRYYGVSLTSMFVHHRLRLLAFPMRTKAVCRRWPNVGSPRFRRDPFVRDGVFDLGRASAPRITVPHMLPSAIVLDAVG